MIIVLKSLIAANASRCSPLKLMGLFKRRLSFQLQDSDQCKVMYLIHERTKEE